MHQLSLAHLQMNSDVCTSNSVGDTLEFSMLSSTTSRVQSQPNILPQSQTSVPPTNIDVKSVTFCDDNSEYDIPKNQTDSMKLNMNNQSSKSFGMKQGTSNSNKSDNVVNAKTIAKCPNMVNHRCKCKEILRQNKSARRIWSACYRINILNVNYKYDNREIEIAYFDGLYGKLSEYFQSEVDSTRIPSKVEISESLKQFGGFIVNTDCNDIAIDRCHFISFWKWFRGITNIIKDLYQLWDIRYQFKLNLFINREETQTILEQAPQGTFALRVSQSQQNGLVVSYSELTFNKKKTIKHILLIRQSNQNYCIKTNQKTQQTSSLNKLIRTFTKLRYIYTPNCIYKKHHVF